MNDFCFYIEKSEVKLHEETSRRLFFDFITKRNYKTRNYKLIEKEINDLGYEIISGERAEEYEVTDTSYEPGFPFYLGHIVEGKIVSILSLVTSKDQTFMTYSPTIFSPLWGLSSEEES